MTRWITATALALALGATAAAPAAAGTAQAAATAEPSAQQLKDARALVQDFFKTLKGELEAAMKKGGPTHAIDVCAEVAPSIAGNISQKSGWAVGRTALKVRNPRNAPSVRERAVLMAFQERHAEGESFAKMEDAAIIEEGGRRYLHYMKAIPTQEVCLACHGTEVEPQVRQAIAEQYPTDAATGFEKGELRGAFTFVKPMKP